MYFVHRKGVMPTPWPYHLWSILQPKVFPLTFWCRHEQMLPLNRLWEGYMRSLISSTPTNNLENALVRADYHGAFIRVIQSKCAAFVGVSGIIVQETMNTFVLLRPDPKKPSATVPKRGCVFSCSILKDDGRQLEWHLFGDQLCQHSGFRSSKKFKSKASIAL